VTTLLWLTIALPLAGAVVLLLGGRATDAWGHLLGCATVIGSFVCGAVLFSHLLGLPAKDRDRLTEPYVTTREKGTGLGLAIVKRICEEHGGELKLADAETLAGARVCLILPLKSQPKPTGAAVTREAKASRSRTVPAAE
jgi:hypothetical protein